MSTEIDQEIAPGIRLRFDTAKALSTFLTEEKERWDAVSLAATRHPSMRDRAVKAQSRRLNAMLTQVAQAVANRPADWAKQLGGLQHFSDQHTNGRILCSLIPADAAVLNLIETDPDAAVIGMSARQREEDTVGVINPHDRADAVLALGRFTIAGAGRPAEAGSFATLSDMVNQAMTGWKNEVARAADLAKGGAREAKKISDAVTTQAGAQATAHNEMLDAHKTALEAIKAQFLSEMSLRAPVEYWKDRAAAGQKTAWNWLKAFVASALILFGLKALAGPGPAVPPERHERTNKPRCGAALVGGARAAAVGSAPHGPHVRR